MSTAFNFATEINANILARLGCNSSDELGPVWSGDELTDYSDEELKRLARDYGLFVQIGVPIATNASQPSYSLPTDAVAVIQAAFNGLVLRPISVREAEALDANWTSTTAPVPTRWVPDIGLDSIRLYPNATVAGTLDLVYLGTAPETGTDTAARGICGALGDLIEFSTVAEARRRESDAQMPEAAQVLDSLASLYRSAIGNYWGGGA